MPRTATKGKVKEERTTTLTVTISPENKKKLKIYAATKGETISNIIAEWIKKDLKVK